MIIFGHRGAAGEAPENTIAALQHAIKAGVTRFEIDLRLSADRELVVLHDRSLSRTTGVASNVDETSSETLAKMQVSGRHGETTIGVPTLQALFDHCEPIDCIQLELKSDSSTDKALLIEKLSLFYRHYRGSAELVATSFDDQLLEQLRQHCPALPIGLVSDRNTLASLQRALELGCSFLCLNYRLVETWNEDSIAQLHASGLHLSLWTVNDTALLERLHKLPVSSIITDYPSRFASQLNPAH